MREIVTRKEARAAGANKYFTGQKCRNGHVAERYTQSGTCEDCIRASRSSLAVMPRAEIMAPESADRERYLNLVEQKLIQQKTALDIQARKIALREQENSIQLDIQARKIALREQENSIQLDIQARKLTLRERDELTAIELRSERKVRQHRTATVKSRLVDVYVLIDPLDYEMVVTMIAGFAMLRDPLLRREDVATGSELKDCRFVMRCFPEDKACILALTGDIFGARNRMVSYEEISSMNEQIQAQLTAEAEKDFS